MAERNSDQETRDRSSLAGRSGIPVEPLIALAVALLALLGIGTRYSVHGDVNAVHCLFSLRPFRR